MYVRQAKQFLATAIEGFDERKYGFASVVDLLRAAGKEGVLRDRARPAGRGARVPGREPRIGKSATRRQRTGRTTRSSTPKPKRSAELRGANR